MKFVTERKKLKLKQNSVNEKILMDLDKSGLGRKHNENVFFLAVSNRIAFIPYFAI